jgi:hypothetical protein
VFFVPDKVGGGNWRVIVQKKTPVRQAQVEVMNMMIGTNIHRVVMDMQMANVARNNLKGIEKGEEMLVAKVEQMEAIVDIEALENDEKTFGELD